MQSRYVSQVVLGGFSALLLLYCFSSYSAPLSPDQARRVIEIYRTVLNHALTHEPTRAQSLFSEVERPSAGAIEENIRNFEISLTTETLPETVNRILVLEKLRRGERLEGRERYAILMELDSLDQQIQSEMDEIDKARNRWVLLPRMLGSIALASGSSLIARFGGSIDPNHTEWVLPVFITMLGTGISSLGYTLWQNDHWVPESYSDSRSWLDQWTTMGNRIDKRSKATVGNRVVGMPEEFAFRLDGDKFPPIPYYEHLLNWASTQANLGKLSDLFVELDGEAAAVAPPQGDHIVIEIPGGGAVAGAGVQPWVQRFRNLELTESSLSALNATEFREACRQIATEMSGARHSFWSHVVGRRLAFLALRKKNADALTEILKIRMEIMFPVLQPRFVSFMNKAVILAAEKNHPELMSQLLSTARRPVTPLGLRLLLEHSTMRRVGQILNRPGHDQLRAVFQQIFQLPNRLAQVVPDAMDAPVNPRRQIRGTAGHDEGAVAALNETHAQLRALYRSELQRLFNQPENLVQVLRMLETRIQEVFTAGKITEMEKAASEQLIAKIEAPFDTRVAGYDPEHIFQWNTNQKKKETLELLRIAYAALEDARSYRELTGHAMSASDRDDRWASWIKNALVDSAYAYAIDGGRELRTTLVANTSSCVPGVNHRILHGLTGLHPRVNLSGGAQEHQNEATWRAQVEELQRSARKQQEAEFARAVFDQLIDAWLNTGVSVPQSPEEVVRQYKVYVTQRAQELFGDAYVGGDEFRTLLETLEDFSERIQSKVSEIRPASNVTHSASSEV